MKNVAGYDVSRLMAGSLGTLGVILEGLAQSAARCRWPRATSVCECSEAEALALMNEWGGRPLADLGDRVSAMADSPYPAVGRGGCGGRGDAECWAARSSSPHRPHASGTESAIRRMRTSRRPAVWRLSVNTTTSPLGLRGEQLIEWGGALRWLRRPSRRSSRARAKQRSGSAATRCSAAATRSSGVFQPLLRRRRGDPPATEGSVRSGGHLQSRPDVSGVLSEHADESSPTSSRTPRRREADAILRKCVHCGFCTATCPTYQLLGDELDGPRGRIYLIKQVLEGATPTREDAAASRPLPHLPRVRNDVPVGRAVRPPARYRPEAGRGASAAVGGARGSCAAC